MAGDPAGIPGYSHNASHWLGRCDRFLKQWRDLASIVPEISFAIGLREGFVPGDVHTAMQELEAQLHARISYTVIQTPLPEAASSRIREGKQEHLVNEAATAYIRQHGLYPRRLSAESY